MTRVIKFKLKDYLGRIKDFKFELPTNSEMNLTIVYMNISGDEVVYLFHFNDLLKVFDSSDCREMDYLDEVSLISLEELEALNNE